MDALRLGRGQVLIGVVVLALVLSDRVDFVRDVIDGCLSIADVLEPLRHVADQRLVLVAARREQAHLTRAHQRVRTTDRKRIRLALSSDVNGA